MSPIQGLIDGITGGFPRTRGDEPITATDWATSLKFSPHARG